MKRRDEIKRRLSVAELAEQWTLHTDELSMTQSTNTASNQLGFALMRKWFQDKGQFPKRKQEIPQSWSIFWPSK